MDHSGHAESRFDARMLSIGVVMLVGIVALGAGAFSGNRVAFYTGLLVTVAGVLSGVVRLVIRS